MEKSQCCAARSAHLIHDKQKLMAKSCWQTQAGEIQKGEESTHHSKNYEKVPLLTF
jgi:hypothetical protein